MYRKINILSELTKAKHARKPCSVCKGCLILLAADLIRPTKRR